MDIVVYFEIVADNTQRAANFYSSVFGWKVNKWGKVGYWVVTAKGKKGPGIDGALMPRAQAQAF